MSARLITGDCVEVMRSMAPDSVDSVVTDPPYGIGFMGKNWDTFSPGVVARQLKRDTRTQKRRALYGGKESNAPSPAMAAARYDSARDGDFVDFMRGAFVECLRIAKPGAHLVAFGSPRRHHRLMCAIEDAGWELRDCLMWLFGNGFPKSHNGAWGGTALKPGYEPIVLARKPLDGTVAQNVAQFGTGALNVDGCRIPVSDADYARNHSGDRGHDGTRAHGVATGFRVGGGCASDAGRWPANVLLDEQSSQLLDEQSGQLKRGANPTHRGSPKFRNTYGTFEGQEQCAAARGADRGGASRFFYCAKASRAEREAGLNDLPRKPLHRSSGDQNPGSFQAAGTDRTARNFHPTVKPIALMRWLVRLVTPATGTVLDPFLGSGSTGAAAAIEGFSFVGTDITAEYVEIARRRIIHWRRDELFAVEATDR